VQRYAPVDRSLSNTLRGMGLRRFSWAVVATVLALSGCGGSDGGGSSSKTDSAAPTQPAPAVSGGAPSTPAAPAAKKRFIKQADHICVAARKQLVPLRAKAVKAALSKDPAVVYRQSAAISARAASIYGNTVGQLRGLDAPPADQAEIDRLNGLLAQTAGIERQISAAASSQNGSRVKQLSLEVGSVVATFRSGAKAYGFNDCASAAGQALNRRGNR
jgi:hypothetical protein